mgnify:CR=1 FL=1
MNEQREVYVFAVQDEHGIYIPQVAVEAANQEQAISAYGAFGASAIEKRQPYGQPLILQVTFVPVVKA